MASALRFCGLSKYLRVVCHTRKKRESETQTSSKKIKSNKNNRHELRQHRKSTKRKERWLILLFLVLFFCIAGIYLTAKQSINCWERESDCKSIESGRVHVQKKPTWAKAFLCYTLSVLNNELTLKKRQRQQKHLQQMFWYGNDIRFLSFLPLYAR